MPSRPDQTDPSQPSMFDDPDAPPTEPVDIDAQIAAIGALPSHRKPEDDRLSEAHADATGVAVAWEGALSRGATNAAGAQAQEHLARGDKRVVERPGGARLNTPQVLSSRSQVLKGKTEGEINEMREVYEKGAKSAKEILKRTTQEPGA